MPTVLLRMQSLTGRAIVILAKQVCLGSVISLCFEKYFITLKDVVVVDESRQKVLLRLFEPASTDEAQLDNRISLSVAFNNPYLLGTIKKLDQADLISDGHGSPIDVECVVKSKLYVAIDPDAYISFNQHVLARYIRGKLDNQHELQMQF